MTNQLLSNNHERPKQFHATLQNPSNQFKTHQTLNQPLLHLIMDIALNLCGFSPETCGWLIDQGLESPGDLLVATEDDIDNLARTVGRSAALQNEDIEMTLMTTKRLKGFRFWADECRRTGYVMDPNTFNYEDVDVYTEKLQAYKERRDAAKDEDPTKPAPFKKMKDWTLWSQSLENYLSQIVGRAKISLMYLIRAEDEPEDDLDVDDFDSEETFLAAATVLHGKHFELDNKRFFREIKALTIDGEAWTYIKRFERAQNGRAAYLALRAQCEGTASMISRKNKAYAKIAAAVYKGPRKHYRFQDYVNAHQSAHNDILACDENEAIPETKKVSDFLKGITDPLLEAPIAVVLGDPTKLSDFEACQQFLSTSVENRENLGATPRGIASMERHGGSGSGGGGGKNGKNGSQKKLPKNFKLEDKFYPKSTFHLLSEEQKAQLKKWSAAKEKRKIATLKKEWRREHNLGSGDEAGSEEDSDGDHAGHQFGRHSHTRGNKKKAKSS